MDNKTVDNGAANNGSWRRSRTDYSDLDGILARAELSLGDKDLRETNTLMKQAAVQATSMWGVVGGPALPAHTQQLMHLTSEVQRDLSNPSRNSPDALRVDLRELRQRFETEERRENEDQSPAKR